MISALSSRVRIALLISLCVSVSSCDGCVDVEGALPDAGPTGTMDAGPRGDSGTPMDGSRDATTPPDGALVDGQTRMDATQPPDATPAVDAPPGDAAGDDAFVVDAHVVPDSGPSFTGSLTGVTLDASQSFDASAQTHVAGMASIDAPSDVTITIDWGDGTTSGGGVVADGASVAEMHQYGRLGDFEVIARICMGTECVEQSLGTVHVGCAAGFDDCSGGIADGCETNVSNDVANCGHCGMACDTTSSVCDAADTCSMGVCQANHAPATTECRASAGSCDVAEMCDGAGACPADAFAASTVTCRASAGVCDTAEQCTGTSAACPSDARASTKTVCRASTGVCDAAETCDGTSVDCGPDAFAPSTTVCRAPAGGCDAAETCTGSSNACPLDVVSTSGTVCRASAGSCDVAETCDGSSTACPSDALLPSSTVCRASAGACDTAESCTGSSAACPSDAFLPSSTVCRASAGVCDTAEQCTGSAAACPADAFLPSSTVCRASTGVCDAAEQCTGAAAACPSDAFAPSSTVCRPSAGGCDAAETCTGSSNACPADVVSSAGTVCRAAAGSCDVAETCNGSSTACPSDALLPSSTVCRASAGACDTAEQCTGSAAACPSDAFLPSSTVCRASAGACDTAEQCTGSAAACPSDAFLPSTTVCRTSTGVCDAAESCTGSGAACPADAFAPSSTVCRPSAGGCDAAETCTGASNACPADIVSTAGTVCRASAGSCDVAETCDGSATACPSDALLPSSTVCRASAGACDTAESCTGSAAACPSDAFLPNTTVCRASAGACDTAEQCTGSAAACPSDAFLPSTTVCRASTGVCDAAEQCTGSAAACPSDAFAPSSTVCRPSAGGCDAAETCTGASNACPADIVSTAGTVCRAAAGACDVAETCNGSSAACPSDALLPNTTVCRAAAGACDTAESCTGSSAACPSDAFLPSSTVCRASAGVCDTAEQCTGSAAACPANAFLPSSTVCRASTGVCDAAESCTGSAAACPGDAFVPNTTVCRASTGVCDAAETCTGSAAACPGDAFLPNTTVCRASAGACDTAESCTGSAAACPGDAFLPNTTVCRASAGVCDTAESCTGSAAACPANAFLPNTTVCRASAGVCDTAESCTGSAAACPGDAFLPNTTVCRASAGVCDAAESCTGSAAACPGDAFLPSSTVCRADADGLGCDAQETCTGSTAACPANGNQPAGTACTSGGMCLADGTCQASGFQPDPTYGGGDGDVEGVSPSPGSSSDSNQVNCGVRITAGTQAGKLLVAGGVSGQFRVGFLARYNADGTVDTTFGTNGYRYYPNINGGGTPDEFYSIAIQSDGKIVAGGYSNGGLNQDDVILVRLNEDGTYDTSFATNGRFSMNNLGGGSNLDRISNIALQSDGKIVATGITRLTDGSTNAMFVMRVNANGTIDSGFGGPTGDNATDAVGVVTDSGAAGATSNWADSGEDIAVGTGGIYVAGYSRDNAITIRPVIWRITTNGRRDTTWDGDGRLIRTGAGLYQGIELDSSNRPVVVGNDQGFPANLLLSRATTGGAFDATFGSGGTNVYNNGAANGVYALQITHQSDGKIVVGGGSGFVTNDNDITTFRFNSNGSIDTSFGGGDGWDARDNLDGVNSRSDDSYGLAILPTGEIVNMGDSELPAPFTNFWWDESVVLRYTSAGVLDTTFGGGDGIVLSGTSGWRTDVAYDIAMQSDGKIVAVGYTNMAGGGGSSENAALWRFNTNGTIDTTFGSSGGQYYDVNPEREQMFAVEIASGDRPVVAGFTQPGASAFYFTVWKYTTAGALDTSFNGTGFRALSSVNISGGGTSSSQANDLIIQPDGMIVAVGSTATASSGTDMAVVRLTAAGALDTGFAGDGTFNHNQAAGNPAASSTENAFGVTLQSDGKIVVVGTGATGTLGRGNDLVVWRLNANGTLDTSFDGDGFATTGAASGAGSITDQGRAVLVQPDGKIVVGGNSGATTSTMRMTVWRYNANGSLDTSWDGDGYYTYPTSMPVQTGNDARMGLLRDSSGRIYVVWTQYVVGGGYDLAVWRLTSSGALDTSFDSDGIYTQHNAGGGEGRDLAHGALFDGSNRIIAGGQTRGAGTNDQDGIVWRFQ